MGIADRHLSDHLQALGASSHLERSGVEFQGGRRAETVAQLQHQQAESGEQQQQEQEGKGGRHSGVDGSRTGGA
jgi:hypothetical protein